MKVRARICIVLTALIAMFIVVSGGFLCGKRAYADGDKVYLGGFPVGISLEMGGVMVESVTGVETNYGTAYVRGIEVGDIITKINGKDIRSADDVHAAITPDAVKLDIIRHGAELTVDVKPIVEAFTQKPRLGVKVKDKLYGVGTVTYVSESRRYAALGHEIYDSETNTHIPFCGGAIHACKIFGVKRGTRGEAGALLASIVAGSDYGDIDSNDCFGISGDFTAELPLTELIPVASRAEVKTGPAKIRTSIGGAPELYDIEIIKATAQSGRKEKGLIFRVTDRRLLDATGGIVRGMSGSPIIQNGKLVGAVTHVILSDFTKGYGVYADCLNK